MKEPSHLRAFARPAFAQGTASSQLPFHTDLSRHLRVLCGSACMSQHYIHKHCVAPGMRTEYRVDKVPFFKHCEEFRMGRETVMGRRDKKSGKQRAYLREVPEGLQIDIQLDQPFPGMDAVSKYVGLCCLVRCRQGCCRGARSLHACGHGHIFMRVIVCRGDALT